MKTSGRGSARREPVERLADRLRARRAERAPGRRRPPARGPSRRWSAGSHHQRAVEVDQDLLDVVARSTRAPRRSPSPTRSRRRAPPTGRRAGRRSGRVRSRSRPRARRPVAEEHDLRHELGRRTRRSTSSRTRSSDRPRTSAAVPFRSLTMKFACFSEIARAADPQSLEPGLVDQPARRSRRAGCGTRSRPTGSRAAGAPAASGGSRRGGRRSSAGVGRLEAERRARGRPRRLAP